MHFVQLSTNQGEKLRFLEKFYYAGLCFTSKTSVNSRNQKENLRFFHVFCTVKYEPRNKITLFRRNLTMQDLARLTLAVHK